MALVFAVLVPARSPADAEPVMISVADGQMASHLFEVRLNRPVSWTNSPRLRLHVSHSLLERLPGEGDPIPPTEISAGFQWADPIRGASGRTVPAPRTGTLLLFSLESFQIHPVKPILRVRPVLEWVEGGVTNQTVAPREVYLGNPVAAIGETGLLVVLIAFVIGLISYHRTADLVLKPTRTYRWLAALCNPDGTLSLWRTQLAAWTVAIGWMVLLFGALRLEVPEVPESLVALMGMSLLTGGFSAHKQSNDDGESEDREPVRPGFLPTRIGDLLTAFNVQTGRVELSIAKAQMVIWTLIALVLFVGKSLVDGALWPVPWQLVALMGLSQAGYVAPKYAEK